MRFFWIKTVVFLLILAVFDKSKALDCSGMLNRYCSPSVLMDQSSSTAISIHRIDKYTELEFLDVSSNQLFNVIRYNQEKIEGIKYINYSKGCPDNFLNTFIYGIGHKKLEVYNDPKSCIEKYLPQNIEEISYFTEVISEPVYEIKKYGFYRIKTNNNIWTYQAPPGYTIDIVTNSDQCKDEYCLDEEKQRILEIRNLRKEYIQDFKPDTNICSMLQNPKSRTSIYRKFRFLFCSKK